MSAFADSAHAWAAAGWGAFPLPAGKKSPPPQGWTGRGAPYPSGADVQAWIEEPENAEANLGLRFPAGVIGIDVDDYVTASGDHKHGLATLVECSKRWGKLPPTVRITSRPETRSGIYLYRLPEGTSSDRFLGELPGGNVEILRPEHRYAVGPGSIHPSGATYVLTDVAGAQVVRREQLPELPQAWIEGLTLTQKVEGRESVELVGGRGDAYTQAAVEAVVRELHDIASWPVGKTDAKGRGWEKIQADAAYRLASLALADWNSLTISQAMDAFGAAAPVGDGWTELDVASKWRSQVRRAEPADPPKTSDDPLAAGFQFEEALHATTPAPAPAAEGGEAEASPLPVELPTQTSAEWVKHSWDDKGNAERVLALFGARLKYLPAADRWMEYDEAHGRWEESKTGGYTAMVAMVDLLPRLETHLYSDREYEKSKSKTTTERKEFLEWVASQRFDSRYRAGANVLKSETVIHDSPGSFDADPMLLNCRNGVIDLRTGQLRDHDPALRLRRQIPVAYDPTAAADRWLGYVKNAHPDDEMTTYLQRLLGYSLTGSTKEQVFFIHQGPPNTGKSLFLNVASALLGDFARVIPASTLMPKSGVGERHPTEIMGLAGRRMLTTSETAEGARLDAALIKRLSGSDIVTARGMGQDFQDFKLVGKIHLVTNHLPHIPDDEALRRRIHIVPWNVVVPVEDIDYDLEEDISREELPGVLAWAVRGAVDWNRQRLNRPAAAHLAALDYFEEEDEFGTFVHEMLVPTEVTWTSSKNLFQIYLRWSDSNRIRPMSKVAFGRKMSKRGFEPVRTNADRGFRCTLKADPINRDPLASS